jgi:hypothetical protein
VNYSVFIIDESYYHSGLVGIRFGEAPPEGSLIICIVDTTEGVDITYQNSSIVKSQEIIYEDGVDTYMLSELTEQKLTAPGLLPYETNVVVKFGEEILTPSSVVYFYLKDNQLVFPVPKYKFGPFMVDSDQVRVFMNGNYLSPTTDYILDLGGISITLAETAYVEGGKLAIVFDVGNDYKINENGSITFVKPLADQDVLEVITFFNHNTLNIDRTVDKLIPSVSLDPGSVDFYEFTGKTNGNFALTRPAIIEDCVWVIKNNKMLIPGTEYVLGADKLTVSLRDALVPEDIIQIVLFGKQTVHGSFGYMQFKDMLNRVHYKRLSKAKSTKLVRALLQDDIEIFVEDGTNLTNPNPGLRLPGVIEINGERIEYYERTFISTDSKRAILRRLRRGTLGTGIPFQHRIDQQVIDIGYTETIPYQDEQIVVTNNLPEIDSVSIPSLLTSFDEGIITSENANNAFSVFAGGFRLKKSNYKLYGKFDDNGNLVQADYPYSPEGDIELEAEFTVDVETKTVNLAKTSKSNVHVIKQMGRLWTDSGKTLGDSNSLAANFIKNTETVWPQYIVDKYQYVLDADQNITLLTDDNDEPLELD